jgi:hypothetical protein
MDPSAVNLNLTVDDFYSVVAYKNVAAWSTPDPSAADFNPAASTFREGTGHVTSVVNESFTFEFLGELIQDW